MKNRWTEVACPKRVLSCPECCFMHLPRERGRERERDIRIYVYGFRGMEKKTGMTWYRATRDMFPLWYGVRRGSIMLGGVRGFHIRYDKFRGQKKSKRVSVGSFHTHAHGKSGHDPTWKIGSRMLAMLSLWCRGCASAAQRFRFWA